MSVDARLLMIVEEVHAASMDDALWPETLDSVADFFGAVGVSFELVSKNTNRPYFLDLSERFGAIPHQEYLDYYGQINIRLPHILSLPTGGVDFDYAFLSDPAIDANEFYADFLSKYDLRYFISGNVLNNANYGGVMAVQRSSSQGHVSVSEIDLMQRFLPHMQQAIDMRGRLSKANEQGSHLLDGLDRLGEGVILIDESGIVLHSNRVADDIFRDNDGLNVRHRMLGFSNPVTKGSYDRLMKNLVWADQGPTEITKSGLIVARPSGRRPYIISLRPLLGIDSHRLRFGSAAVLAFIRDPELFSQLDTAILQQSYDLTPSETELAVELDRGNTVSNVAEMRGVSVNTVRGHLYALMGKVGVTRQSALIRLLGQYRLPF